MTYVKKVLDQEALDTLRANLAARKDKVSPEPACDFCGDAQPVYVYLASRMSTGELRQAWRWSACEICSAAVDHDNWSKVSRRLITRLREMRPTVHLPNSMWQLAAMRSLEEFHQYAVRDIPDLTSTN